MATLISHLGGVEMKWDNYNPFDLDIISAFCKEAKGDEIYTALWMKSENIYILEPGMEIWFPADDIQVMGYSRGNKWYATHRGRYTTLVDITNGQMKLTESDPFRIAFVKDENNKRQLMVFVDKRFF